MVYSDDRLVCIEDCWVSLQRWMENDIRVGLGCFLGVL